VEVSVLPFLSLKINRPMMRDENIFYEQEVRIYWTVPGCSYLEPRQTCVYRGRWKK
jgi:hypothetical protein